MTQDDRLRLRYRILKAVFCWNTDGFGNHKLFYRHYNKHVKKQQEFGKIADWQYLWKADSIFRGKTCPANHHGPPNCNLEECNRASDGSHVRYNNHRNEVGILHGRVIGTFFRPMSRPVSYRRFFLSVC